MKLALPENWRDGLSPQDAEAVQEALEDLKELQAENPLALFEANSEAQARFLEAKTKVVAAIAGNRFGKTTALVTRCLAELCPESVLPDYLRRVKKFGRDEEKVFGRIVNPSFLLLEGVILPAFRKWTPKEVLLGNSFDKAFQGPPNRLLRFKDGSWIQFMTYEQEVDKFGGSALHFCGYDEPPPREIRDECLARLTDFDGYEMFAFTPLKANIGWLRRDIWRKRGAPGVTVVKGTIHDNSKLPRQAVSHFLDALPNDLWRRAREFGDFVDMGGLIYSDFERCVIDPPTRQDVGKWDTVVGIDPGLRNAAFVWVGFDRENKAVAFDEVLLQDKTPREYAEAIREVNRRWAVESPMYVIDPAARARSQTNAETVEGLLAQEGIYTVPGQNDVEAGVQQVRGRLRHNGMLQIARTCVGLRDEADTYAAEDRPDGEFKPIKENDHRLDALRYACMARPWSPVAEMERPRHNLGASLASGFAPPWEHTPPKESAPMGAMA